VATEGLQWALGAGASPQALVPAIGLEAALAAQAGLVEDMDRVSADLVAAYPA
jgi:hypothetical protein